VTRTVTIWIAAVVLAVLPGVAAAERGHSPITISEIGGFSSQASPNHAVAGAHIAGHKKRPALATASNQTAVTTAPASSPPPVPTLPADSPLLKNPQPFGPGTFWYQGLPGQQCVYAPSTSPLCFAIVQPRGAAVDPALLAARAAETMDLSLSPIVASPSASVNGLTGDRSWFWLAGAPSPREVTVALGGEAVRVRAVPAAAVWSFGDGGGSAGGPGVAYQPGPPPAGAITHVYETRCLPGDLGRDPNVLPSCESDGYHVVAQVEWTIAFTASGPVAAGGGLPARTTAAELVYPVSEARAFLVGGAP